MCNQLRPDSCASRTQARFPPNDPPPLSPGVCTPARLAVVELQQRSFTRLRLEFMMKPRSVFVRLVTPLPAAPRAPTSLTLRACVRALRTRATTSAVTLYQELCVRACARERKV